MYLVKNNEISTKEYGWNCIKIRTKVFSTNPRKANVVANTLSRMTRDSVSHVEEQKNDVIKDVLCFLDWVFGQKISKMVILWFKPTRVILCGCGEVKTTY